MYKAVAKFYNSTQKLGWTLAKINYTLSCFFIQKLKAIFQARSFLRQVRIKTAINYYFCIKSFNRGSRQDYRTDKIMAKIIKPCAKLTAFGFLLYLFTFFRKVPRCS